MRPEPYRGGSLPAALRETAVNTAPDYSPAGYLRGRADVRRLPLGIGALNDLTGGGVPLGSLISIAGAPGSAKTALAHTVAAAARSAGAATVFLAPDEGARRCAIRIGQAVGIARAALAAGEPAAVAELENAAGPSFILPDSLAVEEALETARGLRRPDAPLVFILDSLQTAATRSQETAVRLRLEAIVQACRTFANAEGALAILASEANRASYSRRGEEPAAIASAAESRAVEFRSDLLLVLREGPGGFECEIAKNREGEKAKIALTLDHVNGLVSELAEEEAAALATESESRRLGKIESRVLDVLREHPDSSGRRLRELVGGRAADVSAAIERLRLARRVQARPGPNRSRIFSSAKGSDE